MAVPIAADSAEDVLRILGEPGPAPEPFPEPTDAFEKYRFYYFDRENIDQYTFCYFDAGDGGRYTLRLHWDDDQKVSRIVLSYAFPPLPGS